MRRIFSWLDNNLLPVLAGFLLVFIPLYPKWPLFDVIPGYIVRARLEDLFVAGTLLFYIVQLLRRKVLFHLSPVVAGLFTYLFFGFLSVIAAIFILQTVPLEYLHAGKTFLHWLRRVEYFSLFFILFSSIRSLKSARVFLWLFFLTMAAVIIYGYGQKYLYWPAFSTMNREFSKGWWLYLTEHARVLSTFGGHYDLAGYLVIALTLGWSFYFGAPNRWAKLIIALLVSGGFWLLILTASRISFAAYLCGVTIVVFLWMYRRGVGWGISRWLTVVFLSLFVMLSFGDLSERFLHLLKISDRVEGLRQVLLSPAKSRPTDKAFFLENNLAAVTSETDQPPSTLKPGQKPSDVTGKEIPLLVATTSASGKKILVPKQRTYSQNALMYDLSTGIRFDATWPRAIKGFTTDPLLGTGYATLTKTTKYEFTEAESTDNDYLRALGETGFLGFAAFFGTLLIMAILTFKSLGGIKDPFLYSLGAGFIGLVGGLLVNAMYIDIFEASKVAYVFWGIAGITMGSLYLVRDKITADYQPLRLKIPWREYGQRIWRFFLSDFLWLTLILLVAFAIRTYKLASPLADWHSWRQADTSAVTRDFVRAGSINWLYPTFEDISSVPSGKPNPQGWRFVEFPLYNAASVLMLKLVPEFSVEEAGRATTALASVSAALLLFLICRKILNRRIAYLTAIAYSFTPYSIYYGRTVLPDTLMVALSLGAIWWSIKYLEEYRWRYVVLAAFFASTALLVKPFAVFLLIPIAYLMVASWKRGRVKNLFYLAGGLVLAAVPLVLWRLWMNQFPEGIPANSWLLNGDGIRFKGAFWYWLFADRIGRLILGYWGLVLVGLGLIRKYSGRYRFFPLVLFLASVLYLVIFATGNVRHDYYQILIVPALSILVGSGLEYLLFSGDQFLQKFVALPLGFVAALFMLGFGWYFVRDLYNINHPEIVAAGRELWSLVEQKHEKALAIAPYDGDTAFLYQTGLKGWPLVEKPIDEMISQGADYYVSVKFDDLTNRLIARSRPAGGSSPVDINHPYILLARTDQYVIIQLVPDNLLPD